MEDSNNPGCQFSLSCIHCLLVDVLPSILFCSSWHFHLDFGWDLRPLCFFLFNILLLWLSGGKLSTSLERGLSSQAWMLGETHSQAHDKPMCCFWLECVPIYTCCQSNGTSSVEPWAAGSELHQHLHLVLCASAFPSWVLTLSSNAPSFVVILSWGFK